MVVVVIVVVVGFCYVEFGLVVRFEISNENEVVVIFSLVVSLF